MLSADNNYNNNLFNRFGGFAAPMNPVGFLFYKTI